MTDWRPVVDWEDLYEVSDDGQIRRSSGGVQGATAGRVLRQTIHHESGYPTVGLHRDGFRQTCTVHRLVARAFHGEPAPRHEVRHLDGNALNCSAANLAWGTHSENEFDKLAHGTHFSLNQGRTHCRRNHEFTEANTHTWNGHRECRACRNEAARRRRTEAKLNHKEEI